MKRAQISFPRWGKTRSTLLAAVVFVTMIGIMFTRADSAYATDIIMGETIVYDVTYLKPYHAVTNPCTPAYFCSTPIEEVWTETITSMNTTQGWLDGADDQTAECFETTVSFDILPYREMVGTNWAMTIQQDGINWRDRSNRDFLELYQVARVPIAGNVLVPNRIYYKDYSGPHGYDLTLGQTWTYNYFIDSDNDLGDTDPPGNAWTATVADATELVIVPAFPLGLMCYKVTHHQASTIATQNIHYYWDATGTYDLTPIKVYDTHNWNGPQTQELRNYPGFVPPWPTVASEAADPVDAVSATLNGTLSELGDAAIVNVSFEWGTDTSYGSVTTSEPLDSPGASFSADLTGLTTCTDYHFRAKAVGNGTVYGVDQTFTTLCLPTFSFSSADPTVGEGDGTKTITVNLSQVMGSTVYVDYATSDGTATFPDDYDSASDTLTFEIGETSQTFDVTITDDGESEGDETIILTLSNANGAALGTPNTATLTIQDDDGGGPSAGVKVGDEIVWSVEYAHPYSWVLTPYGYGPFTLNEVWTETVTNVNITKGEAGSEVPCWETSVEYSPQPWRRLKANGYAINIFNFGKNWRSIITKDTLEFYEVSNPLWVTTYNYVYQKGFSGDHVYPFTLNQIWTYDLEIDSTNNTLDSTTPIIVTVADATEEVTVPAFPDGIECYKVTHQRNLYPPGTIDYYWDYTGTYNLTAIKVVDKYNYSGTEVKELHSYPVSCEDGILNGDEEEIDCGGSVCPACPDCNGDPGGTAYLDGCYECVGGNTGEIACIPPAPGCFLRCLGVTHY
jgi:hypothetical protein